MKISEQIIAKRRELSMTQKELADKLDVTDKTVSRWERDVTIPDVEMLKKLSVVIGLDLNDVFNEIEVKINETEVLDLESIKKYRIGYVTTVILFVFSSVFFFLINILSHSTSDNATRFLFPFFFVLSIVLIMGGVIVFSISFIKFHSAISIKEHKRVYKSEIIKSVITLILSCALIVISIVI